MPGIADIGLDREKALILLDGIYSIVGVMDMLERSRADHDPILLCKIILSLALGLDSSYEEIKSINLATGRGASGTALGAAPPGASA